MKLNILHFLSSEEAMFLITTLSHNILTTALHLYVQNALESIPTVLTVTSLIRYGKHRCTQ